MTHEDETNSEILKALKMFNDLHSLLTDPNASEESNEPIQMKINDIIGALSAINAAGNASTNVIDKSLLSYMLHDSNPDIWMQETISDLSHKLDVKINNKKSMDKFVEILMEPREDTSSSN